MPIGIITILFVIISGFIRAQGDNINEIDRLHIGMTLEQIRNSYPKATLNQVDGWKYYVDGGGYGTEIIINNEIHFFVYSINEEPEIVSISIISSRYELMNGVHVGMSVSDLMILYPKCTIYIDILGGFEYIYIRESGVVLVFSTTHENRIGIYDYDGSEPEFIGFGSNLETQISRIRL